MSKRKSIFNLVFLLVVFAITFYSVFKGEDIEGLLEIMKTANPHWLLLGVFAVVIFIWCESIIIFYLMRTLGIGLKKWKCFWFPVQVFSLAVLRLRQAEVSQCRYI